MNIGRKNDEVKSRAEKINGLPPFGQESSPFQVS
jgi:hypothetical protein